MKLSEIIGKQVFDIYNASILGTIHEANFSKDYKKTLGFYFFDQEENEFYIKTQNIYSIFDFVTIKNSTKISEVFDINGFLLPLGKTVVNINGKNLGNICDIELNNNFEIEKFYTNTQAIEPQSVITIHDNIVVGDKKHCEFSPKYKAKTQNILNTNVSIMKIEEQPKTKLMPTKITVNSDILLGKKLNKDIFGKNNELILKQNLTLSAKHLMLAKQHEKLNELFYSVY